MNVVHVVFGKANPERPNGVNGAVHGLATAVRRAGVDVEVWGMSASPEAPTSAREYGLRLFRYSRLHRLDPELVRSLDAAALDTVFHFHGGFQPEFHALARRLAARSVAWVLTPHGAYRTPNVRRCWAKKRLYLALFDGALLRGARAVQCFSTRERDEVLELEPNARVVVVPNGQALLRRPEPAERGARPTFGFCGRLAAHEKGLDLLLDGFALYARAGGTGELRIVGDGPDREPLAARARRLGVAERVHFLGACFGERKLAQLAAFDAFVQPSRTEGMPLGVLEAAALGLPCIVSRETNLAEAFERSGAGLVLERNDAADIAEALRRCGELALHGELAAFGERGRELIGKEFDWSSIAERCVAELYAERVAGAVR